MTDKNILKGENLSNYRETSVKKGDKVTKRSGNILSRFYSDLASSLAFWTGEKDLESEAVYIKPNNQLSPQVQSNLNEIQINGRPGAENPFNIFKDYEALNLPGKYSNNSPQSDLGNNISIYEGYSRGV